MKRPKEIITPINKSAKERKQLIFEFVKCHPGCSTGEVAQYMGSFSNVIQKDRALFTDRIRNVLLDLQAEKKIRWVNHQYFPIEDSDESTN